MSETIKIIILGIIQGLTEFLPVSSSGHLVLGEYILGLNQPGVTLEVVLHLGTLIAVVLFYYKSIWNLVSGVFSKPSEYVKSDNFKTVTALIIGSIPAGIVGVFFDDYIESIFDSPRNAALFLIITGIILLLPRLVEHYRKNYEKINTIKPLNGFIIGIAQAFAIMPGISRSGSTITMARILKIDGKKAAEFSFLLSIPAILGATVLKLGEAGSIPVSYIISGICAAIVGYISILLVIKLLVKQRFYVFGIYCILVGISGYLLIK